MAKINVNMISYTLQRTVDLVIVLPSVTIPESLGLSGAKPSHVLKDKFPVLYLLHGFGNNQAQWTGYTNVELYAEERQIAVVCFGTENKAYAKVGGDDFFTFLNKELPEFITNYFPVSTKPEDTYLAGLSMGGYGTLLHGLTFPEKYHALGVFSGAVKLNPDTFASNHGGAQTAADPAYDPASLAVKIVKEGKQFPPIYMACGQDDFLYEADKSFMTKLRELGADVTWEELPGYTHEWRFWDLEVEKFLDWIPRTDSYAKAGKRKV